MKNTVSVKARLIIFGLCISLIPITVITSLYYFNARKKLHDHQIGELTSIAEAKKIHLLSLLESKKSRTIDFGSDGYIRNCLERINSGKYSNKGIGKLLSKHLINNKQPLDPHLLHINVLDTTGKVIASTNKNWVGTDMSGTLYFKKGLLCAQNTAFVGQPEICPLCKKKRFAIAAPLYSQRHKKKLGILLNCYDLNVLNSITMDHRGMAETAEIYLVNRNKLMFTESRFVENAMLNQKIDTEPVKKIFSTEQEMTGIYPDYRGIAVVGVSSYIPEYDWTLLSEIDKEELFAPLLQMSTIALSMGSASGIIVIISGVLFAFSFSRPLSLLKEATKNIASGVFSHRVPIKNHDEFGELAHSFNTMAESLDNEIFRRKQVETQLLKLSQAMEQSPASVIITDIHGNIEYANQQFCETTGYTFAELRGKNPRILKSGKTPPEQYKDLWETITAGKIWAGEFINKKKDGELFHSYGKIGPLKNTEEAITHYVALREDVTEKRKLQEEQKKLTEQVFHMQKLESVGRLASSIAHDFNNYLTAIIGYAHVLKINTNKNDPSEKIVNNILRATEKASDLSQRLLTFGRKRPLSLKKINLNDSIKNMESLLLNLSNNFLEYKTDLYENELPVSADPGQIEQAVMNLAINAKDAMPNGGVLSVKTAVVKLDNERIKKLCLTVPGKYATLSVSDTGTGIDENHLQNIFEPFFTTKEPGKGTGLGLSIVYGIIQQHNGAIDVSSEPGKGTTFILYLPLIS
ncbi:MAG: PAS domain S-box protein [Candidatus Kuenenia sp.]|nr:PAS domain S-box protein [Candidatus Kuenenia hertensis]